ncbi:MAG: hypothetical protein LPK03_15640 [Pontibacter sp.]|nr:hypothetical protein [Pontibacter sp.]
MIQKALFAILVYCSWFTAYSQAGSDSVATAQVMEAIAKSVRYPIPSHRKQEAGVALLRVVKKGEAVAVESLYASNNAFDFALSVNHQYLLTHLQDKISSMLPDQFEVIVPLEFSLKRQGQEKLPPAAHEVYLMLQKAAVLKQEGQTVVDPIVVEVFPPMQHGDMVNY